MSLKQRMHVETLQNWTEIDRLAPEWSELLERSQAGCIFHSWEWLMAWRQATSDAAAPYIIVVRAEDGQLLGIAPLYLTSLQLFGFIPYRVLRFVADVETGAEYPDWIVDRQHAVEATKLIAGELMSDAGNWDLLWLTHLAGWTGAQQRIIEPAEKLGMQVRYRPCPFSSIPLPSSMADYEARYSSRSRQQLRRGVRKIHKLAGVEICRCETPAELDEFLDALVDLHQRRWKSVGVDGVFRRKPAEEAFYRRFARHALDNDWLRLYGLKVNGEFKAVQYGYVYDGVFLQLQEGYDPEFQSGTGNALRHHVIAECIDCGVTEYDFLGGESEHKRRWLAEVREGMHALIAAPSWKSRLPVIAGIWPTGRFFKWQTPGSIANQQIAHASPVERAEQGQ